MIGDPWTLDWNDFERLAHPASVSPNGRWAAVVVERGNPQEIANVGQLLLFDLKPGTSSKVPRRLATFSSTSDSRPLARVQWLNDNRTLVFAASSGEEVPQVYRLDIKAGSLEKLTSEAQRITTFEIDATGRRLVTFAVAEKRPMSSDPACSRTACQVTASSLYEAQHGLAQLSPTMAVYDLQLHRRVEFPVMEENDSNVLLCRGGLSGGISEGGRYGLQICHLKPSAWPKWWHDYKTPEELPAQLARKNDGYVVALTLHDFETGQSTRLTLAPSLRLEVKPQWLDQGRWLALPGSFLPTEGTTGDDRRLRSEHRFDLIIEPQSRFTRILGKVPSGSRIAAATWDKGSRILTIDRNSNSAAENRAGYAVTRDGMVRIAPNKPTERDIELVVEQSANRPPRLIVNRPGRRPTVLLEPNSWLSDYKLAPIEEVSWTASDGRQWNGGLYLPDQCTRGRQCPLVIQAHGFSPSRFSPWGATRNFPGQALAAKGIVVLQMSEQALKGAIGTPEEWPAAQRGYEAAIDFLSAKKLIDPDRVGLIGWSRTGPHVGYFLTHTDYPVAAAAFTDTGGHGYWSYLKDGLFSDMEADYGATPFGSGLSKWLSLTSSFNFDRMRTPMLMWQTEDAAAMWDWYAGLRRLDLPVEYWISPAASHNVNRLSQRMWLNQYFVDWFSFWLQNEERTRQLPGDGRGVLVDRYASWKEMRVRAQAIMGQPRPAPVEWQK